MHSPPNRRTTRTRAAASSNYDTSGYSTGLNPVVVPHTTGLNPVVVPHTTGSRPSWSLSLRAVFELRHEEAAAHGLNQRWRHEDAAHHSTLTLRKVRAVFELRHEEGAGRSTLTLRNR